MAKQHFIILDGSAIFHRAWHAVPPLTSPKGEPINAAYGFTLLLLKIIKDLKPTHLAVAFDLPVPTFRHEAFKEYKAHRERQPQELYDQIPKIKKILEAFGIQGFEKERYEADDIIATLCDQDLIDNPSTLSTIVTGDLDALQLVDDNTNVVALKRGVSETVLYDTEKVFERYRLRPDQLIFLKALAGDPSDNIPGVPGVGEKTALKLVQEFGSLDKLYEALDRGEGEERGVKKQLQVKLLQYRKEAERYLGLVRLVHDVPIDFDFRKTKFGGFNRDQVVALFNEFGFRTLIPRISEYGGESEIPEKKSDMILPLSQSVLTPPIIHAISKEKLFAFALRQESKDLFGASLKGVEGYIREGTLFFVPEGELTGDLKKIFEDASILKIGYDIKATIHILLKHGVTICPPFFDTMIGAYLRYPGRRTYELESIIIDAGLSKFIQSPAKAIFLVSEIQKKALQEKNVWKLFEDIELPLIPILARMEAYGIKIDRKFLTDFRVQLDRRFKALEEKIWELAGGQFNISSPLQLRDILFQKLQLQSKGLHKIKTGISTAASELEKLRGKHPIVDLIFEHRELAKLLSTYVEALPRLADSEGRIHTRFNQTIAATGRLSSSEPNLQNIPIRTDLGREIRKAFVAQYGYRLLSADYSQIELRVAASLSRDQKMINAFLEGADIHTKTASEIFKVEPARVSEKMRRIAKTINFGVTYGMGASSLAASAGVSGDEAKDFIDRYFALYAGLARYLEETKDMARALGYVETLFGRKRFIPEITSRMPALRAEAERAAVNSPIQGTAADLMKIAMIKVDQATKQYGDRVRMLLQVHDELVFEIEDNIISEVSDMIQSEMEQVYKLRVPLLVEVKGGENWGQMQEIK